MSILTQYPVTIDLSVPAMEFIVEHVCRRLTVPVPPDGSVECEVDNFQNLLRNLIERNVSTVVNNEDLL